MDETNGNTKYESFKIPGQRQVQDVGENKAYTPAQSAQTMSMEDEVFYEIEYDSCSIPGVGKFVPRAQKIEAPKRDEKRELFGKMRDIARAHHLNLDYSRFFDRRVHYNNTVIFYKQGLFMKDFTDDYSGNVQFSQYFPYYQRMSYEQLRTYFTWRTKVREGYVSDTSLSYAFLYIYELLSNIGVKSPQDGLEKLMFFWKEFSVYNKSIDPYVLRWLKDYHIYYPLPQSLKEFIHENNLTEYYPPMVDTNEEDDNFELFCAISNYDIRKSVFLKRDNSKLVTECFSFVINKLRQICNDKGIRFDESIFQPTKKMSVWTPFKDALFYPWMEQPNRRVVLSKNEIYICNQNKWVFSTVIASQDSRQLIGYIMKQMESVLRKATKYKFKLTANIDVVSHKVIADLNEAGLSLETLISDAVLEFYREATKTVVKVDPQVLSIIRQEALTTQQKLIVDEQDEPLLLNPLHVSVRSQEDTPLIPNAQVSLSSSHSDVWENYKRVLTATEIKALSIVLHGETGLKQFADDCGIMLEVLVDSINEKAVDVIGDNLIDEEFVLYEDYRNQVKELVG